MEEAIIWIVYFAFIAVVLAGNWKVFEKAGEPGWAVLVPFYNTWVLIKVSDNPWWFFVLMFIPLVQIYPSVKVPYDIAKEFGQGAGFGLGMIFLPFIFFPLLGFGDYEYQSNMDINQ